MINSRGNLFAVIIGLGLCLILVLFSTSTGEEAKHEKYEVNPLITLPEYKTETDRAMDAYERMMNRLMDLNEKNFSSISTDVKDIAKKLESIDNKLTELTLRIERIERAMEPNQTKLGTNNDTKKAGDVNEQNKIYL
jgi:peptidoglycan hydrolase CwlO-like protein